MLWTGSFNLKVNAERQYAVLDPDLEIRGVGGGGSLKKNFFRPFGPQFSQRIGGGRGGGRTPPLYPPLIRRIQFDK